MTKGKIRNRRVVGDGGGGGGVPGERGLNRCYYYLLHGSSSLVRTKFMTFLGIFKVYRAFSSSWCTANI